MLKMIISKRDDYMTKVLLIQGQIPEYRVPIFNKLAEKVDLTLLYSEGNLPVGVNFKTIKIPTFKLRYNIHKKNIYFLAQNYDVVICMMDFSYLYFRFLYLLPHKYKLIYWGIGVSASYNERYDNNPAIVEKCSGIINKTDAAIFYSQYPTSKYAALGVPEDKLFVANNTVRVDELPDLEKDSFLFVGSLYKQKKIEVLLEAYLEAYKKNRDIHKLVVIGGGDQYDAIDQWIRENGLEGKIVLTGAIFDEAILKEYFAKAFLCISPDQAGLSVLKSMGYGVPFVTHKDSITGGEIFNIKNRENGILLDSFDEIENILTDCTVNPGVYLDMGVEAKKHYDTYRTVDHMVSGFVDAVEYVMNK